MLRAQKKHKKEAEEFFCTEQNTEEKEEDLNILDIIMGRERGRGAQRNTATAATTAANQKAAASDLVNSSSADDDDGDDVRRP